MKDPEIFLLDEPYSNLDAALRGRMRTEVKHLHLELGTTTVFVTHDQEEAMVLSDFIAVMSEGHLVQFGTQEDVYARPIDLYVAGFVGKPPMSIVEGLLHVHEFGVKFAAADWQVQLPSVAELGLEEAPTGPVKLGIRAEDVSLGSTDNDRGSFQARVGLLEPIGSDTFVELLVGEHRLVARVAPASAPARGDVVTARIEPRRVHLFDVATGRRLNTGAARLVPAGA